MPLLHHITEKISSLYFGAQDAIFYLGFTFDPRNIAMDRCILLGSSRLLAEWRFAPVGAKARKQAAGTHLSEVGSSLGRG